MFECNYLIQEAVEKSFSPAQPVAEFKKLMNTCQLTKFRAGDSCGKFYSAFFLNQVEDLDTTQKWAAVYMELLNDIKFVNNLCGFMTMFQPADATGMFRSIVTMMENDLSHMKENRVRLISDTKALFTFLQTKFNSITDTIKAQVNDINTLKFCMSVNGTISTWIKYCANLLQREIDTTADPNEIEPMVVYNAPLEEDVVEILHLLETGDAWIQDYIEHDTEPVLTEGIVTAAAMKAKELAVKTEKANRAFDEFIMKRVRNAREKRRNRKHAEMVGEALRINNELKRLLVSLGLGALNPALGVIHWVVTVAIDRATDKRDRDILIGQIKDELEITEEKIAQAERNGDDKAKIELIRFRQRLEKEYQRINRVKYDGSRVNRR